MVDYEGEIRSAVDGEHLVVPSEWEGFPGQAFGGFVAAALLLHAASETDKPRPLSCSVRFHRPTPLGRPVSVALRAERRGRSVDVLAASVRDAEREIVSGALVFGRDGQVPLRSQAVPAMTPVRDARPVWQHLQAIGVEPGAVMRRVGFRGEMEACEADGPDWHLRSQWPWTASNDLALRAAVALLPIDCFVGPAAMRANGVDLDAPWPVIVPSLDLAAWFYAPESPVADADADGPEGWLTTRTSVPVTHAGYTVGRTQVWSGDRLVAEGMSQVALVPAPAA